MSRRRSTVPVTQTARPRHILRPVVGLCSCSEEVKLSAAEVCGATVAVGDHVFLQFRRRSAGGTRPECPRGRGGDHAVIDTPDRRVSVDLDLLRVDRRRKLSPRVDEPRRLGQTAIATPGRDELDS